MKPKFNIENYKGDYIMHCNTEEKANVFCKYLNSVGREWWTECSYLTNNSWDEYTDRTCYLFNYGSYSNYGYFKRCNYTILEFDDFDWEEEKEIKMVKEFTKSDLKNGMVVETRDKTRFLVNGDILVGKDIEYDKLDEYNNDLIIIGGNECDIVKVYTTNSYFIEHFNECDIVKVYTTNSYFIEHLFDDVNLTLIWERNNEMETKEYRIKQPYIDESGEDEPTIIKIHPNNSKGYHKSDSNCPIVLEYDEYYGFGLTIDSAKEMIKDLQEIVDYMEEK